MKGRDVIFLYFANNTSDTSWKQIIKEYKCVGPQTVHYNLPHEQQKAVEAVLRQGGYPSYGLFDKEGRLGQTDTDIGRTAFKEIRPTPYDTRTHKTQIRGGR